MVSSSVISLNMQENADEVCKYCVYASGWSLYIIEAKFVTILANKLFTVFAESVVCVNFTSRRDYCNYMLAGLTEHDFPTYKDCRMSLCTDECSCMDMCELQWLPVCR